MMNKLTMEITKGLNNHPFLFLLAELSLSSNFLHPFNPENVPDDVRYYANPEGELTPIIAGTLPQAVHDDIFFLGVNMHGNLHPIFDRRCRWILVHLHNLQTVVVTAELYHNYSHLFPVRIISLLENHYGREFVMPRRPCNASPNRPANSRHRNN